MTTAEHPPESSRTYLVTGATSGIGASIAIRLAATGHHVIIGARSHDRADAAASRIRGLIPYAKLDRVTGDLAELADVTSVAAQTTHLTNSLDGLILNAAVFRPRPEITAEGYEINFVTNYVSGFLLTRLLMPSLLTSDRPRVVTLTSSQHSHIKSLDVATIGKGEGIPPAARYTTSKLLNILFVKELARRMRESPLIAAAADPGFVRTDLGRDLTGRMALLLKLTRPIQDSPEKAAATPFYLATAPQFTGSSGGYFSALKPGRTSPLARDPGLARQLWTYTSDLLSDQPPPTTAELA